MTIDRSAEQPFVRYRALLDAHHAALDAGWSDDAFVDLVLRLDDAVDTVEGRGFRRTPLVAAPALADATGAEAVWVKDDTGNVAGSHKARHLFGVLLHLAVSGDPGDDGPLAIASCGNAALAAGVVARARGRPLRVFVPTWADPGILGRLEDLDAAIEVCERRAGESGDPAYLRFVEAVENGATPFSVQGTMTPTTIDGGRTLGWEAAEQLADREVGGRVRVFLQIGGGAMATAVIDALTGAVERGWLDLDPVYHPVQTEACAPLARAWDRAMDAAGADDPAAVDPATIDELAEAFAAEPGRFMEPWEPVGDSAATGILDDVAYDWVPVVEATLRSGGRPVVVPEGVVGTAHRLGRERTGIDAGPTGTAGLAGLLALDTPDPALLFFTGRT